MPADRQKIFKCLINYIELHCILSTQFLSFFFVVVFKVAEYLSDPLCRGIFAGDTRLLSLKSCFPSVYQYENQHGSILKGAFLTKEGEH